MWVLLGRRLCDSFGSVWVDSHPQGGSCGGGACSTSATTASFHPLTQAVGTPMLAVIVQSTLYRPFQPTMHCRFQSDAQLHDRDATNCWFWISPSSDSNKPERQLALVLAFSSCRASRAAKATSACR